MELRNNPVYLDHEQVGEVTVTRQGLYYRFACRVQLPSDSHSRLYAYGEGDSRDLGLLVPNGNYYELQTRVPVKYFGPGEYRFCLDQPKAQEFIRVSSNEPFSAVDRLEWGKFAICGGKRGIVFDISGKSSDSL